MHFQVQKSKQNKVVQPVGHLVIDFCIKLNDIFLLPTVHNFHESGAQCYLCKTILNSLSELKSHISECHSNEFQKFRCDFCNFGTNKRKHLRNHNIAKHSQVE